MFCDLSYKLLNNFIINTSAEIMIYTYILLHGINTSSSWKVKHKSGNNYPHFHQVFVDGAILSQTLL